MTITKEICEYGFPKITVRTLEGGTVGITDYRKESTDGVDIGTFRIINQHGLGSNSYIRNIKELDKFINQVDRIVWIQAEEKAELKNFLEEMKA